MGTVHIPPRRGRKWRLGLAAVGGAVAVVVAGAQAWAGGSVSFSLGVPIFAGPPVVYGPPVYGPPVGYAPPPAYYYPEPAGSQSTTVMPQGGSAYSTQTCKEYQTITTIDGAPQQSHGTACLQPDGTWRLMN
jgi:hypothetical protein